MKKIEIEIADKNFLLDHSLTVYIGKVSQKIYKQFLKKNLFGVNFSYGDFWEKEAKNNLKVFIFDKQIYERHSTLGYFGDCLKLTENYSHGEVFALGYENNPTIILRFLLDKLMGEIKNVDLVIFNGMDGELNATDKLHYFKIIENIATVKPVLVFTEDLASLKLSQIQFEIIDVEDNAATFLELVNALQNNEYENLMSQKHKKNEKSKGKSNRKVAKRSPTNKEV